ncbi:MAG: helix-turn-helix domain-containing protein [Paludibacteraceae bacterium]|nr:helix-turn-helix domain-containing protein [Paludibacteraceae bacterium]
MDKRLILNKLILHFAEGNNQKFAEKLGITPTSLSNWKARGTIDYEKIYTKCEGINPHWLLTGEGEMFVSKDGVSKAEESKQTDNVEEENISRRLDDMEKREAQRDFLLTRIADTLDGISKILAHLPENPEKESGVKNHSSLCG